MRSPVTTRLVILLRRVGVKDAVCCSPRCRRTRGESHGECRYRSGDEVLRSAMRALAEVDDDLVAVQQALSEWRGGDEGIPLEDAFRQIRAAGLNGVAE